MIALETDIPLGIQEMQEHPPLGPQVEAAPLKVKRVLPAILLCEAESQQR